MTTDPNPRQLVVVETATAKIVHRVDVTGRSERAVGRVLGGMLINMDTERFHVEDTDDGQVDATPPTPQP